MLTRATNTLIKRSSIATRSFASGTDFVKFDFKDPYNLEELLTDEEIMIRDQARKYA